MLGPITQPIWNVVLDRVSGRTIRVKYLLACVSKSRLSIRWSLFTISWSSAAAKSLLQQYKSSLRCIQRTTKVWTTPFYDSMRCKQSLMRITHQKTQTFMYIYCWKSGRKYVFAMSLPGPRASRPCILYSTVSRIAFHNKATKRKVTKYSCQIHLSASVAVGTGSGNMIRWHQHWTTHRIYMYFRAIQPSISLSQCQFVLPLSQIVGACKRGMDALFVSVFWNKRAVWQEHPSNYHVSSP